jgi:hypothetical protein
MGRLGIGGAFREIRGMGMGTKENGKVCSICSEMLPLSQFYTQASAPLGVSPACKACLAVTKRKHYEANKEKYAARQKEYNRKNRESINAASRSYRAKNKQKKKEARKRYDAKYPLRPLAQGALFRAVSSGCLHRPEECSECGMECVPQGHHNDYSKPLDVIWLCPQCHANYHANLRKQGIEIPN